MISIPPPLKAGFARLASLNAENRRAILRIFGEVGANDDLAGLDPKLRAEFDFLTEADSDSMTRSLVSLIAFSELHDDLEDLSRDLARALIEEVPQSDEVDEGQFSDFFLELFETSSELRMKTKAKRLAREKPNLMIDARIIADAIPVFELVGEEEVGDFQHFVMSTTLRIDYLDNSSGDGNSGKSIFLGVDDSDLEKLEKLISRARKKKSKLQEKLADAHFTLLEE